MAEIVRTVEMANLSRVAAARKRAAATETKRADDTEAAIRRARDANVSWAEISERLGISEGQAKWLIQRHHTPEALARQEGDVPRTAPRPGRGPGVGVTEAARLLGLTRRSVYQWCNQGRLQSVRNEQGKVRVLLEKVDLTIVTPGADENELTALRTILDELAIDTPGARTKTTASDQGEYTASVVVAVDPSSREQHGASLICAALTAAGIAASIATAGSPAVRLIVAELAHAG